MLRATIEQSQRLATFAKARRERLGLTQSDVAKRAGLSLASVQVVEAGTRLSFQNKTVTGMELALGWEAGGFRGILDGAEPRLLDSDGDDSVSPADAEVLDPNPALWTPPAVLRTLSAFARQRPDEFFRALYDIADVHRKVTGQDTIGGADSAVS